jgi:hypothetical protein
MNRQQILHEQAALTQKLKEITPREYVSQMTRLRSELSIAEKQICDDYDRVVLENKILKEKSLSAIELNEAMLPKSYLRISERFPHLTMKEIIEFYKKVRENGGSIKVHGGAFISTERETHTCAHSSYKQPCYVAWTCCHHIQNVDNSGKMRWAWPREWPWLQGGGATKECGATKWPIPSSRPYSQIIQPSDPEYRWSNAPDLQNRNPIGLCDNPVVFYLNPEENLQDIKGIKVSDVSTAISSNIILLESAIQEYSIKIDKWKELQTTLDCLV